MTASHPGVGGQIVHVYDSRPTDEDDYPLLTATFAPDVGTAKRYARSDSEEAPRFGNVVVTEYEGHASLLEPCLPDESSS